MTRRLFTNPIFWSLFAAYLAGLMLGHTDPPLWVGGVAGAACASLTGMIERWYVRPRPAAVRRCVHGNRDYCGFCGGPVPQ
jgi:hypothetical protein